MTKKFRQYHECQNGHPRFLYWKPKDGFTNEVTWGDKHPDCNCPTFSMGEGFIAKGPHEQFMDLEDKNGIEIFEGDRLVKEEIDFRKWEAIGFDKPEPFKRVKEDVATMENFPMFWLKNESFGYEGEDLEHHKEWIVIGNVHDKEPIDE